MTRSCAATPKVSIQAIRFALWPLALCDWCRVRSGHCGDGRHPGVSREGVAYRGEGVGAVLDGGGRVAADGVTVAGCFLRAEPSGDLLLGLRRAQVSFGLVGGGGIRRASQERGEACP